MTTPAPTRVMVCDDSVVIRSALTRLLESDPGIQVVARTANGQAALDVLRRQKMDVVLLDIEMPVMDGMTALPLLLEADPDVRIVMSSTHTTRGADIAMRALRLGAADTLAKPASGIGLTETFRTELLEKVKGLARQRRPAPPGPALPTRAAGRTRPALIAVGSSTGGPQALLTLMQGLATPPEIPIVITQHMPPLFLPTLAEHLTRAGATPCHVAEDGAALAGGHAYLAPGDRHLLIERAGDTLLARHSDAPPQNFCRPAVDPMFRSAAEACRGRVLAVVLTGMGQDGLEGARCLVEAGGTLFAQDEPTSVVWGMPGAVARAGLCHAVLPMAEIAPKITAHLRGPR